jgi:hypothetical protein
MENFDSKLIIAELNYAIKKTSSEDLIFLAAKLPIIASYVTLRRGKNFKDILVKSGKYVGSEGNDFFKALLKKQMNDYLKLKYKNLNIKANELSDKTYQFVINLYKKIKKDPKNNLSELGVFILGAYLGSGGIDGDGGIPDTDLLMGVGDHRSIFTHSIIAGIVIETLTIFAIFLIDKIYENLPTKHSEIWDKIHKKEETFLLKFTTGVSAGLAYHFTIDATIDGGGTYKDLPFTAPQEIHQLIMGVNAFIEGIDSYKRKNVLQKIKSVIKKEFEKFVSISSKQKIKLINRIEK